MQKVPLELVKPGMVLAKPVLNEKGMALCAEGTELNATLIERLKRMNVSSVTLKGHPVDLGSPVKSTQQKIAEMQSRFAHVAGDPLMERLKAAIQAALMSEGAEDDEAITHQTEGVNDE